MKSKIEPFIKHFPPMGVYETLFKFLDATGKYMGTEGTHPWAQGFPLTKQLPGGPGIPLSVEFSNADLKYPPATGGVELLEAICNYYKEFYGAKITADNIAVFAGGRPAIYAAVTFLREDVRVLIEETEYTPYYDLLKLLNRNHTIIPSNPENNFAPSIGDYKNAKMQSGDDVFVIKSNPCNPTGVTWSDNKLKDLVTFCCESGSAGLIDEAYEFFHQPVTSAMQFVDDIDNTELFVVSAATKGLQVPGARVGWVVASKRNIEIFRNFSSIAMGGVARPSQIYVSKLLEISRVNKSRDAVSIYYGSQRRRYGEALSKLGLELFTGEGGFYHWARLPRGLTADQFNERLFKLNAAILPGTLCDMFRRAESSPLRDFIRFSFGPLEQSSFDGDIDIIKQCL